MADVTHLVARLGLADPKGVITKASEFVRVSTARLGEGGLGQVRPPPPAATGCSHLPLLTLGCCVAVCLLAVRFPWSLHPAPTKRRGAHERCSPMLLLPLPPWPCRQQGELCKGAACVELACMSLGVTVDAALVTRFSGVKEQVRLLCAVLCGRHDPLFGVVPVWAGRWWPPCVGNQSKQPNHLPPLCRVGDVCCRCIAMLRQRCRKFSTLAPRPPHATCAFRCLDLKGGRQRVVAVGGWDCGCLCSTQGWCSVTPGLHCPLNTSSSLLLRYHHQQFGCARHDQSVRACLTAFKVVPQPPALPASFQRHCRLAVCRMTGRPAPRRQLTSTTHLLQERYVRSLPPAQQAHVDFGRAVFLAAAFYLVARKNKVAVSDPPLLGAAVAGHLCVQEGLLACWMWHRAPLPIH